MPAIRQHFRNSEREKNHLVCTCIIQHMILCTVYFYIYRLAQSVRGQNYGLDNKRTNVGFAAEKEILVFHAPTTWELELIQPHAKRKLGTFLDGKSGWE